MSFSNILQGNTQNTLLNLKCNDIDLTTINGRNPIPNTDIQAVVITNSGQVIASATTTTITGTVNNDFGLGSSWSSDTFTASPPGGVFEVNLTFSEPVGDSADFSLQVLINGVPYGNGLADCQNGVTSFSSIFQLASEITLQLQITNTDLVLDCTLSSMYLSIKQIKGNSLGP